MGSPVLLSNYQSGYQHSVSFPAGQCCSILLFERSLNPLHMALQGLQLHIENRQPTPTNSANNPFFLLLLLDILPACHNLKESQFWLGSDCFPTILHVCSAACHFPHNVTGNLSTQLLTRITHQPNKEPRLSAVYFVFLSTPAQLTGVYYPGWPLSHVLDDSTAQNGKSPLR